MAMNLKLVRRTAGSLLLCTGMWGCPTPSHSNPKPLDPRPVIGDHSEQRDTNAPAIQEDALAVTLLGQDYTVRVPLLGTALGSLDHASVTVRLVDGQTEAVRANGSGSVQAGATFVDVTLTPDTPLFTAQEGLGAAGRFILVVEASNHVGTTRVRRDLFRLLPYLDVQLLAPKSASAAGTFALRANVRDVQGGAAPSQEVHAILKGGDGTVLQQQQGQTDAQGELELTFTAPDDGSAAVTLGVQLGPQGSLGTWESALSITQSRNVLLTTDKPRYQPGQMMNLRALAFTGVSRAPYQGPVVFEVSDAKGNLLFKQAATTNNFGVASTSFRVGARVNEGTWKARVGLGQNGSTSPVARQITVEKYVLPRFKVELQSSRDSVRPSESALITVHAGYTFGVALNGGQAHLQATLKGQLVMDQVAALNSTGDAQFSVQAPSTPDGRAGNLDVSVEVTDSAGGKATGTHSLAVVPQSVVLTGWWAGATSAQGRNTLYALLSDSVGAPVTGQVSLMGSAYNSVSQTTTVDAFGLAVFELSDLTSNSASRQIQGVSGAMQAYSYVNAPAAAAGLRVAVTPPVVAENTAITVHVDGATAGAGNVSVDVYASGSLSQTLVMSVDALGNGSTVVDHAPGGLIRLVARQRGSSVTGVAAAYARQDRALNVGVAAGAATYKPRETAALTLNVTNSQGVGVPSAVGLTVVDEAVYALADVSGPVKAFSQGDTLDAPQGMPIQDVLANAATAVELNRARAVLAFGSNADGLLQANLGDATRARAHNESLAMVTQDAADIGDAAAASGLQPYSADQESLANWLNLQRFLDPWGNPYLLTGQHSSYYAQIQSNGPDEVSNTLDDVTAYVYAGGHAFNQRGGGVGMGAVDDANNAPAPGPQPPAEAGNQGATSATGPGVTAPVRRDFPETLLTQPMVITDNNGLANVEVPLADSITSWRVSAVASDQSGRMGTGSGAIRVFQDFFVDVDVPTQLTQDDEVAITAVINNFLPDTQQVTLMVDTGTWGSVLSGNGQTVTVPGMSVSGASLRIKANRVGLFPLQLRVMGAGLQDAVARNVRVAASGTEKPFTFSDRLQETAQAQVVIPANATAGATEFQVKIQPGVQAEMVNGLDSMLRMPGGCFEQTSSSNYPNVLVMAYLRGSGQSNPEAEGKARQYMQEGYQRLTSFEVTGGGFSWFGEAPAHNILTAYGLMEFVDMAEVFPVDAGLIARTATWLAGQQKPDGSFEPTAGGIAEGAINAFQTNVFRTTAFLTWALQRAGGHQGAVDRAKAWLAQNQGTQTDAYGLATYVNLLAAISRDEPSLSTALGTLLSMTHEVDGAVSFPGSAPSALAPCGGGSTGQTDLEVTALAAHGLIKAQAGGDVAKQALTYLVRNKDSFGTWQSTQATIRALQALTASLGAGSEDASGQVTVLWDGAAVGTFDITAANANLQRVVDLSERATPGTHQVDIQRTGTGNFQYQVAGRWFVPRETPASQVTVTTQHSNAQPAVGEAVTVTTTVESAVSFEQLLVDISVPPGFDVDLAALQALVTGGTINRAEVQGTHVHVYVPKILRNTPLTLTHSIRPRLAALVAAPATHAYAYYDPSVSGNSAPVTLTVR